MDNSEEALIRRENARSACQRIALHKPLTQVLAQNLDDTATLCIGELVPLKVSAGMLESAI